MKNLKRRDSIYLKIRLRPKYPQPHNIHPNAENPAQYSHVREKIHGDLKHRARNGKQDHIRRYRNSKYRRTGK